jgi:hypothetical protein
MYIFVQYFAINLVHIIIKIKKVHIHEVVKI